MNKFTVNPGIYARLGEDNEMELVEFIRDEPKKGATLGKQKEHVFETIPKELFDRLFSFTNV